MKESSRLIIFPPLKVLLLSPDIWDFLKVSTHYLLYLTVLFQRDQKKPEKYGK